MANEAPDRIWAKLDRATVYMNGSSPLVASTRDFSGSVEYIRADLATLSSDAARDALTELDQLRERVKEMENDLSIIRSTLASTDVAALPDDYQTTKMAEDRIRTLNERTLEGLGIIGRAETAEARVAELVKADETRARDISRLTVERDTARDRVVELDKALEPFDGALDDEGNPDEIAKPDNLTIYPCGYITYGDLRTARRVREGGKV